MLRRLILLTMICMMLASIMGAQETRGTIVGRVTDATGAVVSDAEVFVLNKAMGTTVRLRTNQDGLYSAPLLLPGAYQISVTAPGFKKFVRDDVQLQVADRLEVNAGLELGTSEQTITVAGTPDLLSTESASLGNVVSSKQIMDLPLAYGNPFALVGISSGSSFTGNPRLNRPFEPTHIAGYAIDGTRSNRSDITLDGAPVTATADAGQVTASYVPLTDILSEFKVQTATFDAAQGNTEGGVTNLMIRSGTNQFHGTAYFGITRKSLWANDFFNNTLGRERGDFRYNKWGTSFTGPVWIPKLYNGSNKTFFTFGYEGIHDSRPRYDSSTPQVPTDAMKNGDFSALLGIPNGSQYQIYNPYTRRLVNGHYIEDPFPGNLIPASMFNPVGKAILDNYYPSPVSPGNPDGTNNFLIPSLAERAKYYNYTVRADHNIGEKQRLFARYSTYRRDSTYNDYFGNAATGTFFQFFSHNGVLDDTLILSPTLVLDLRYGYNRFIRAQDGNPAGVGFDLSSLGFPASYDALIPNDIQRFPRIDLSGYIGTGFSGEYRPVDTHSFTAALTKTLGAHSLRGGMDFRAYRENDVFFSNDQTGRFIFDSSYTKGPRDDSPAAPSSLGQSVAALLLGLPSSSSYVNRASSYAEQSTTWGFYFQDDWKATTKLTLNLGLRWEFETPLTERYNRSVKAFDPTYVQPFAAAAQAAYALNPQAVPVDQFDVRGGFTFAGINGAERGLYNTPKGNLLPRFGFAYQLDPATVIRGGFGMYQGFLGERRSDVIQSGFSQQTPFVPFDPTGTTIVNTLSNPFPSGVIEPVGAAGGYQTFLGNTGLNSVQAGNASTNSFSFFNQNPKMPRMNRWQLDIQRQLPGAVLFEIGYVGNKGTALDVVRNINALPNQYLSTANTRAGNNASNAYLNASIPNPFIGLLPASASSSFTNQTIARQQLLVPYPAFGKILTTTNEGYSWYHSLQVHVEKRFSKGLNLIGNYTWSKFMQATELLNEGDPAPTEMISDLDAPHRITANFIYELPFGKGRRFFSNFNPVVDRLIGGWEVTGLWSFQSGLPLNFNSNDYFFSGIGADAALPSDERNLSSWFNQSAFATGSANQPVTHLRVNPDRFSSLRAPRINNVDFSLIKDTRLGEGQTLRFSAQALNVFNHPLLPTPNLNPASAQFGTISGSTQANYPRNLQLELKLIF